MECFDFVYLLGCFFNMDIDLLQANHNAREGRVMIFNLVEAAQEFLSEIVPVGQAHEFVSFAI